MPLSSFVFSGYPAYLEAAAEELDRPAAVRGAGRLVALTALANLCAQASRATPSDRVAILLKASEFRDQLAVALRASEAMLTDVGAVRVAPEAETLPVEVPPVPVVGSPGPRRSAKGASS